MRLVEANAGKRASRIISMANVEETVCLTDNQPPAYPYGGPEQFFRAVLGSCAGSEGA